MQILATSEEDIKGRLIGAGEYFLCVDPDGVPEELRDDVKWVQDQLTRFEAVGNEGSLRATMRKIQKRTGVKIAKRIVYIYFKFTEYVNEPIIQSQDSNDVSFTKSTNGPLNIKISL